MCDSTCADSLARELDETLRELTEAHRVATDLENQIHEEGGFIERIVDLEEKNGALSEEVVRLKDALKQWERAHDAQRDRADRAERTNTQDYYQRLL